MKIINIFFIIFFVFPSFLHSFELINDEKKFLKTLAEKQKNEFEKREKFYLKEISLLKKNIENLEHNKTELKTDQEFESLKKKSDELKFLEKKVQFPFSGKNDFKSFFQNTSKKFRFEFDSRQVIMQGYSRGLYKEGENYGYVKTDKSKLIFIPAKENQDKIKKFFNKGLADLPVYIGKGTKMEPGFIESVLTYLQKGGVMIYPIVLTGIAGFILTLFQGIILFYLKIPDEKTEQEFFEIHEKKDEKYLRKYPSLVFLKKLYLKKQKALLSSEIIDSLLDREIKKLERFNPTIGVLAGIAPLIGLLGTVTGMIMTFNAAGGTGAVKAAEMAGGISEALVTTQLGLSIALPLMIFHHFFEQRLEMFVFDLDEKKNIFLSQTGDK